MNPFESEEAFWNVHQGPSENLYRDAHSFITMCVHTYVHGGGRGAAPVFAVDESRTADLRELLYRRCGNRGGIPPGSLPCL